MKTGQVGKKNISHLLLRMKTYTERRRMKKKITSLLVVSDKDANKRKKVLRGIIHIHFLLQKGIG